QHGSYYAPNADGGPLRQGLPRVSGRFCAGAAEDPRAERHGGTMTPDLHDLTDDALRRHLAERLGWRNLRATDYWQEGYYSTDHITDALEGIPPDGDGMALVPDWPTDEGA